MCRLTGGYFYGSGSEPSASEGWLFLQKWNKSSATNGWSLFRKKSSKHYLNIYLKPTSKVYVTPV